MGKDVDPEMLMNSYAICFAIDKELGAVAIAT